MSEESASTGHRAHSEPLYTSIVVAEGSIAVQRVLAR